MCHYRRSPVQVMAERLLCMAGGMLSWSQKAVDEVHMRALKAIQFLPCTLWLCLRTVLAAPVHITFWIMFRVCICIRDMGSMQPPGVHLFGICKVASVVKSLTIFRSPTLTIRRDVAGYACQPCQLAGCLHAQDCRKLLHVISW